MPAEEIDPYFEREQTRIKHLVLEKYLERFARIVASRWEGILYVDGFSGPWQTVSEHFKDSSRAHSPLPRDINHMKSHQAEVVRPGWNF